MISQFLFENYLWIKAFHIISVMFWMAGMFYLPRLFVYHTRAKVGSEMDKTFIIMERKLMKIIINPAMIFSFLLGLALIHINGFSSFTGWFHMKLLLLLGMLAIHILCSRYRKDFAQGKNKKSEKFFRIFNEASPILALIIVILAVVKPF